MNTRQFLPINLKELIQFYLKSKKNLWIYLSISFVFGILFGFYVNNHQGVHNLRQVFVMMAYEIEFSVLFALIGISINTIIDFSFLYREKVKTYMLSRNISLNQWVNFYLLMNIGMTLLLLFICSLFLIASPDSFLVMKIIISEIIVILVILLSSLIGKNIISVFITSASILLIPFQIYIIFEYLNQSFYLRMSELTIYFRLLVKFIERVVIELSYLQLNIYIPELLRVKMLSVYTITILFYIVVLTFFIRKRMKSVLILSDEKYFRKNVIIPWSIFSIGLVMSLLAIMFFNANSVYIQLILTFVILSIIQYVGYSVLSMKFVYNSLVKSLKNSSLFVIVVLTLSIGSNLIEDQVPNIDDIVYIEIYDNYIPRSNWVDEIDNYLGRGYSLMEGQYEQIKYKDKSAELILSLIEQINNGESVNGLGEYNIVFYLSNGRRVYRNYLLSEFSDNSMSIEEILNQLQKLNYDETLSKRILADDEIRDQVTFESISVYLSEANKEYRIPLNQKESMDLLGDLIIDHRLVNTDLSIFTNRLVNDRDFSSGMYLTLHTNLGDVEYHLYDYTETYKYVMNIVNKY